MFDGGERREWIREMTSRLAKAKGETHVFLPLSGGEEWDRPGRETHDPEALAAMIDEACRAISPVAPITDPVFRYTVLLCSL